MKKSDIFKLLDAGFTHDEILAMESDGAPAPDPDPAPASDSTPDPAPASDPTPDPAASETPSKEMQAIAELTKTVESLVKAQQMQNRAQSNTQRVINSTDEILSNIINPKKS